MYYLTIRGGVKVFFAYICNPDKKASCGRRFRHRWLMCHFVGCTGAGKNG